MNFDSAFDKLLGHEGGYSNLPSDPGGETNWGISKRSYPTLNIASLTQFDAKVIYKRDFWDKCQIDLLPNEVKFDVFDAAVNSGVKQSIQWLQQSVGAEADGVLGPQTLKAISELNAPAISAKFNGHRLMFMSGLKTWSIFGGGWARRIANNLLG